MSPHQIALSCQIGQATISDYLRQANQAGLRWSWSGGLGRGQAGGCTGAATAPRLNVSENLLSTGQLLLNCHLAVFSGASSRSELRNRASNDQRTLRGTRRREGLSGLRTIGTVAKIAGRSI